MLGAFTNTYGRAIVSSRSNLDRSSISHRPMIIKMSQFHWASTQADVEAHLRQAIPVREPLSVFEPKHHLVFAAPRNTAPALCIAACELVGGHRNQAMAAASALHLMHAAAFTHEHLLLTDKPKLGPMINHRYGPNIELLTGGGLFSFGYELLARSIDPAQKNSERVLRAILEMSCAMGSQGMIDGQYHNLLNIQSNGHDPCHVDRIKYVSEKKGQLHACGAACGAILGGGNELEIEGLRKYGLYVGMMQEMLQWVEGKGKEEGLMKEVEKLRNLAIKELEGFREGNFGEVSMFVNV